MIGNHEFREQLRTLRGSRTVILGVGNVLKGDDGVGPLVCEALAGKVSARVIDAGTVPENYIRPVIDTRPQVLLVVDAVDFRSAPGAIGLFRPDRINDVAFSTHALSLRLFVDVLAREIEFEMLLLGLQPACTQLGRPVSGAVLESIRELTEVLCEVYPASGQATESCPGTSAR